jgi:hypothetical protein
LSGLNRAEPDPALFAVPVGYSIRERAFRNPASAQ